MRIHAWLWLLQSQSSALPSTHRHRKFRWDGMAWNKMAIATPRHRHPKTQPKLIPILIPRCHPENPDQTYRSRDHATQYIHSYLCAYRYGYWNETKHIYIYIPPGQVRHIQKTRGGKEDREAHQYLKASDPDPIYLPAVPTFPLTTLCIAKNLVTPTTPNIGFLLISKCCPWSLWRVCFWCWNSRATSS